MHDCCDCDVIPRLHIDAGGDIFMPLAVRRGADDECDDAPCLSVRGAAIVARHLMLPVKLRLKIYISNLKTYICSLNFFDGILPRS